MLMTCYSELAQKEFNLKCAKCLLSKIQQSVVCTSLLKVENLEIPSKKNNILSNIERILAKF